MGENEEAVQRSGGGLAVRMLIILYALGIVALGIPHLHGSSAQVSSFFTKQLGGLRHSVSGLVVDASAATKGQAAKRELVLEKKTLPQLDKLSPKDRKALDRLLNEGVVPK